MVKQMPINTNTITFAVLKLLAILLAVAVAAFVVLSFFGLPSPVNYLLAAVVMLTFFLFMLMW